MPQRFIDRVVLVTGAAGGLGRAIALGFGREGARLILADVDEAGLAETAALLAEAGADSWSHRVDLADEDAIRAFGALVGEREARLDVLVNNAGLAYGEIATGFAGLGQAKWLRFLSINTVAPLLLAEAVRDRLAAGPGAIINQSSMAALAPGTAYGVTKAALNAMTYGMARDFGATGVRVNAIAPGLMDTPASRDGVPAATWAQLQAMQMVKRGGEPDDIVNLALFLASTDAGFITGEIVHCDGGHGLRGFRH